MHIFQLKGQERFDCRYIIHQKLQIYSLAFRIAMSLQAILKQGNVHSFNIRQNTVTYTLRIAHTPKGLWVCIQESYSQWKLTITNQLIEQTVSKASGGKETLGYKQFLTYLLSAINKQSESWSIGIMTPIELELLRGGNPSKQTNSNKLYLILSNKQKKLHFPFTLALADMWEKDKLIQAIRKMKQQLEDLKTERADKSQSSFSILNQTMNVGEQLKLQNQQLKKKIKMYEESLTQKRGAVEIDLILKQKNTLQIKAETKRRQQNKEIARLKNVFLLMEKQNNQIETEIDFINKQTMLLQDSMSNPAKLKNHAMRVLKSYENQLRTCKKVTQKQVKEIQNLKRNIMNSKNVQKRHLGKIKQLQQQIEQAKKKTNIKEISNRLYSNGPNSRQGSSVASSDKAPSQTSSNGKPKSYTSSRSGASGNLVRQNLLKKTVDLSAEKNKNHLLKTTPNIKIGGTPTGQRKTNDFKPPQRPVVSSYQKPKDSVYNNRARSSGKSDTSDIKSSHSIEPKKRQFTQEEKQKQKAAMARLTGARPSRDSSKEKESLKENSQKRISEQKRQVGGSLQSKTKLVSNVNNSTKDVLKKMKEVKEYYNNKAQIHAENSKNFSAKMSLMTEKK